MKLQEYDTYEERENAFRQSVFQLIPRTYSGPKVFWSDFNRITGSLPSLSPLLRQISYITGNPRDCLALGTPSQILTAAALRSRRQDPVFPETPESAAEMFELQGQFLQPVRSLSGGEAVKLALARAYMTEPCSSRLVAASPFSWLSRSNHRLFQAVLDRYHRFEKDADILILNGENHPEPVDPGGSAGHEVHFHISFQDVRLELGDPLGMEADDRVYARVMDREYDLCSPCLIQGDNGQGKSLIAKTLSGALPYRGSARIDNGRSRNSPARLLFQDMTRQTLLRSVEQILSFRDPDGSDPVHVAQEILQEMGQWSRGIGSPPPVSPDRFPSGFSSLLELKIVLAACRLACQPPGLILDEPDWGLSRMAAAALVSGVITAAHRRGIPVILITHKPWWDRMANSVLETIKGAPEKIGSGDRGFGIDLLPSPIGLIRREAR